MTDGNNTGSGNIWPESSETMNGAQRVYLQRLCEKAGVAFNESWTEAEVLQRIDELEA